MYARTEHLFIDIFYTSSKSDISKLSLLRGQATFSGSHAIQLLVSCLGHQHIFYLSCYRSMDADLLRHRARRWRTDNGCGDALPISDHPKLFRSISVPSSVLYS